MTWTESPEVGIVGLGSDRGGEQQVPRLAVAFAPAALGMTSFGATVGACARNDRFE